MYNFSKDYRDTRYVFIFWVGLLVIMLIRNFFFGFTYFRFLDDYNTYGVFFRRNSDIFNDILLYYRNFRWRPFAALADAYITQWFWPAMQVVLLFYTLMHFFTVYFFHRVMVISKINFSLFGIIIISLTPILAEAVYWIGAATRLVPGMFLSILSVYFLLVHISYDEKNIFKRKYLLLYILFNFASVGFYEQIVVFNLTFTLLIVFLNRHRMYYNVKAIYFTPIMATIVIFVYYLIMSIGDDGTRVSLVNLFSLFSHAIQTSGRIINLLVFTNYEISINGFFRGITLIFTLFGVLSLVFIIAFVGFLLFSSYRTYLSFENESYEKFLLRILIGIILTLMPFAPFFILQPQQLPPRTIYPSIFGIAILLDTLISIISNVKFLKQVKYIIHSVLVIPFFLIYIAEVNNYRLLEKTDNIIIANFLEAFYESGYNDGDTIILFNTRLTFADVTGGGSPYRLENVTSSNWAMQGIANATSDMFRFTSIQPVRDYGTLHSQWIMYGRLFGIDEDLNIFQLNMYLNRLYVSNTSELFGYINFHENGNYIFNRLIP